MVLVLLKLFSADLAALKDCNGIGLLCGSETGVLDFVTEGGQSSNFIAAAGVAVLMQGWIESCVTLSVTEVWGL